MSYLVPTRAQIAELSELDPSQPITMLNLLRFHPRAVYKDGDRGCSGREAYRIYMHSARGMIEHLGGSLVRQSSVLAGVIGPEDDVWDEMLLVSYPNVVAFQNMLRDPDYLAIVMHRTAALADSRLICLKG